MLLIFDLDDTLIDTNNSILPKKLKEMHSFLETKGISGDFNRLMKLTQKTGHGSLALRSFLKELNFEEHSNIVEEKWYSLSNIVPTLMPNCVEVLNSLKETFSLALVSFGFKPEQERKLTYLPEVFKSVHFTTTRDKKKAFRKVMNELGFNPKETIIIGDHISDVLSGNSLGCVTVQIVQPGLSYSLQSNYRISDLNELLELVKVK